MSGAGRPSWPRPPPNRRSSATALLLLTPDQREVIVYRFFAGLTPREIGSLMGKREGSIRALQFRAMETLRLSLEPQEFARAARAQA